MTDATPLSFELPAVARKKLTVDFDGGNQSSDASMLLLRGAEKTTGVLARLAAATRDRRDLTRIRHRMGEMTITWPPGCPMNGDHITLNHEFCVV
jgi:hypothetical protein